MQAKPIQFTTFVELAVVSVLAFLAFGYGDMAGAFSRHMMIHIVLMTLVAPVLAGLLRKPGFLPFELTGIKSLPAAAVLQAALFLAWHSPHGLAIAGQGGGGIMQATLLFSALWFWLAVFNQAGTHVWLTVFMLLLTGKLFCLFAVLLTFAPRVLFGEMAIYPAMPIDLADQQTAGLLMITACPLTYVLAAIVLVYRWFQTLCDAQRGDVSSVLASESAS